MTTIGLIKGDTKTSDYSSYTEFARIQGILFEGPSIDKD